MEDVVVTREVLAVLDGHNGRECADFVATRIGCLAQLQQDQWVATFTDLDDAFRSERCPAGSTCVAAIMHRDHVEVANLGDSRAVLFRSGDVLAQTMDHKPSAAVERERIQRCGGRVDDAADGPARVGSIAVSRAFGTYLSPLGGKVLKDQNAPHADHIVSCVPDLFSWSALQGDVLVLACDGVWDVLSAEEVAKIEGNACERAQQICERALEASTDNVSCIVAQLGGTTPVLELKELPTKAVTCSGHGFNQAARADQLEIGRMLEYGETLIEMMEGLETDLILDAGELLGSLWLGQVGDSCHQPFLDFAKVTRIVNCAAEVDRPRIEGIDVFSFPWRDSEEQGKAEQKSGFRRMRAATRFINESLSAKEVVLVHCVQGVSRSASLVVAFLMEFRGMTMDEAVALVRERHPTALKPFRLQEMLRAFQYFLKQQ